MDRMNAVGRPSLIPLARRNHDLALEPRTDPFPGILPGGDILAQYGFAFAAVSNRAGPGAPPARPLATLARFAEAAPRRLSDARHLPARRSSPGLVAGAYSRLPPGLAARPTHHRQP